MARYDPERMEPSARDRVALANYTEITQGRGGPNGGVFDISHLGKDVILEKLPRMYRQFLEYQMLDISQQPMEVALTAHYSMGGVVVDPRPTPPTWPACTPRARSPPGSMGPTGWAATLC